MKGNYAARLADTLMKRYPRADQYPYKSWTYPQGFMLWGMIRLWEKTGEQKYYDYIMEYVDFHVDSQGNVPKFRGSSMDDMMTGSVLVWALKQTGDPRLLRACEQIRRAFEDYPRNEDGGFWHGRGLTGEMWVDGVFMGQMFLSKYGAYLTDPAESKKCFDETALQLRSIYRHCRKEGTGLLYHAWSQDKKPSWADPQTGRSPEIWCEGLGWYALILAEVLAIFPKDHPEYQGILQQYRELAESLKQEQDEAIGLWYQVVDKKHEADNWCDTSGSAMFLYSLVKGIEMGLLPAEEYQETVRKGYEGVISQMREGSDGLLDVYNACDGLCVQDSYDVYINYPRVVNAKEAVAACLWAVAAVEFSEIS